MKSYTYRNSPTGVQHKMHVSDDEIIIEEYTPTQVQNIIKDEAARIRAQQSAGKNNIAVKMDINTYMQWRQEWMKTYSEDMEWTDFFKRRVNSNEYNDLRTGHKRGSPMKL